MIAQLSPTSTQTEIDSVVDIWNHSDIFQRIKMYNHWYMAHALYTKSTLDALFKLKWRNAISENDLTDELVNSMKSF